MDPLAQLEAKYASKQITREQYELQKRALYLSPTHALHPHTFTQPPPAQFHAGPQQPMQPGPGQPMSMAPQQYHTHQVPQYQPGPGPQPHVVPQPQYYSQPQPIQPQYQPGPGPQGAPQQYYTHQVPQYQPNTPNPQSGQYRPPNQPQPNGPVYQQPNNNISQPFAPQTPAQQPQTMQPQYQQGPGTVSYIPNGPGTPLPSIPKDDTQAQPLYPYLENPNPQPKLANVNPVPTNSNPTTLQPVTQPYMGPGPAYLGNAGPSAPPMNPTPQPNGPGPQVHHSSNNPALYGLTPVEPVMGTSQLPPCKLGSSCAQTADNSHKDQFSHPCRYGVLCRSMDNTTHTKRFYHPQIIGICSYGVRCSKQKDDSHIGLYMHPCKYDSRCSEKDPFHWKAFFHPSKASLIPKTPPTGLPIPNDHDAMSQTDPYEALVERAKDQTKLAEKAYQNKNFQKARNAYENAIDMYLTAIDEGKKIWPADKVDAMTKTVNVLLDRASKIVCPASAKAISQFKVVSYNILAAGYASKSRYAYCHPKYLAWKYRELNLLTELRKQDAEVICLQELEKQHYEQLFLPKLKASGYSSTFVAKQKDTTTAPSGILDGCAMFWKGDVFRKDKEIPVRYPQSEHVGLILLLSLHSGGKQVCVTTTHISGNPKTPHERINQLDYLTSTIATSINTSTIPVVICGDFNSKPDSGVYKYMAEGRLAATYRDDNYPDLVYAAQDVSHKLSLKSAYAAASKEPDYTVFTNTIQETVDYIWFTPILLGVVKVDDHWRKIKDPLPNQYWSSDHISIAATFTWIKH